MNRKLLLVCALVVLALGLSACGSENSNVSSNIATREIGGNVGLGIGLIIGLSAVVLIVNLVLNREDGDVRKFRKPVTWIVVVVSLLIVLLAGNMGVSVDQGEIGVQIRMGRAVQELKPGFHFIVPYVDKAVMFSTRDWTYVTMSDPDTNGNEDYRDYPVDLITSDGVQAQAKYTVQGRVDPEKVMLLYQRYGTLENAITQLVKDPSRVYVRNAYKGFDAKSMYLEPDSATQVVVEQLGPKMAEGGLELILFGFRKPALGINGDYEAQLNAAMVAEQTSVVAEQNILVKQAEAQQAIAQAEGAKQVTILQAEANAAQVKIQADADAYAILAKATSQSEANLLLAKSITAELIQYLKWTGWDGRWPTFMSGDAANMLFDIPIPQ